MNEFENILRQVHKTYFRFSGTHSDTDSGKKLEGEIVKRDENYTKLLDNYLFITKIRNSVKEIHKWLFFWIIISLCAAITILIYKTIGRILSLEDYSLIIESMPILVTALISFATTAIAIPLAITNFLFNTKEDDNIAEIIQHMQDHDMASITLFKERFSKRNNTIDFSDSDKK